VHPFVRDLITEWRRLDLPVAGGTAVVAVSGGADSVSLLIAIDELVKAGKLDLRIVSAHFNHRLRAAESHEDEEFVRHLTSGRCIELATGHGDISADGNLEQNARVARYAFLRQTAENLGACLVAAGHTVNDQAETFLINLIRGSGVDGLSAMRAVRVLEGEKRGVGEEEMEDSAERDQFPALRFSPSSLLLVRPLLNWAKRKDTEGFCRDLGVDYRYDTMNEDTAFRRVRIRKVLVPLLEDINPNIVETLANTAKLMQHLADANPPEMDDPVPGVLELAYLKKLSKPDLYRTIRTWLKAHRGTTRRLELKHIEAIERLIFSRKSGKTAELPGDVRVVRSGGKLAFDKN
jgi:tRNA(Ile)-lysidine synthase